MSQELGVVVVYEVLGLRGWGWGWVGVCGVGFGVGGVEGARRDPALPSGLLEARVDGRDW